MVEENLSVYFLLEEKALLTQWKISRAGNICSLQQYSFFPEEGNCDTVEEDGEEISGEDGEQESAVHVPLKGDQGLPH